MMQPDFHLSPEEAALVESTGWLITKQRVIGKVYGLYGVLSEKFSGILDDYRGFLAPEVFSVSPKIYKGEMYRQLPYVMLDHPRSYSREDVFAIRCFFWWGNHFSIHLLLGGKFKIRYERSIRDHISEGTLDAWYYGISEDPWEHHFEPDNYALIHDWRRGTLPASDSGYIKLGKWHPLEKWKDAYSFYITSYTQVMEVLSS